ncbi:hypothetical protein FSP39_008831 [Pinctada imbricata]|uniref:G-protein coupled receptors family 1 profile domain-containing protein n=1 Tax=Pinctada imbricata TaxID=66713 RepID=A0AA89C3H4_PINIB|nr:hypothetical protein FSP39_008831 [Pinctada imbricata]
MVRVFVFSSIILLCLVKSSKAAENGAEEEEEEDDVIFPISVTIPMGIAMGALILLAIVGNLLTILSFLKDKKLHTVYNIFILNLAVTDLLIGCISMGIYSSYDISSYHWHFGYHFCKTWLVIDFTLCLESVLIMFILSIDRLLLLKLGPMYTQKATNRKAYICIGLSWTVAFLLYSPAIIGYDIWTGHNPVEDGDCDVPFVNDVVYTSVTAVFEFLVPLIGISIISIAIYIEIRKRILERNKARQQSHNNENHASETKTRRDIRAAKFLAALVLVFAVTWAPYTICTVIISFSDHVYVTDNVYETLTWINWSKASMNPFLYALNSARFRKNFRELLCCMSKCKNHNKVGQGDLTVINRTEVLDP